jgi:serine/threonine protein kinase
MAADRWERIEQLCQAALEREEAHQAAFLDAACGGDQDLRREVESLLAHRQHAENFLEAPAMQVAARALAAENDSRAGDVFRFLGRLISHYRIVEKVASGGMGDVFRAVRADGTYDQQVAIKFVQGARSTDFFLARFQNERQILADLDHPNIARLLDGGTTDEGLPYLVMELIEGLPIDEHCAQKGLNLRERLQLFRTVCSAVQYAHQNLVVHRDLKPRNILVTPEGVPKLLDFGIAKILSPQRSEENLPQPVTLLRMLTPDYASPEQLRHEPISTASDVYSLGVILYELLTGQSPYRVSAGSPQEMMKAICDTEPEKPSTAARRASLPEGSIGKRTSPSMGTARLKEAKPEKLFKVLAGDLDNIVLKALRKEPQRRYSSVEQFSEDIRRHLENLPVTARKDAVGYRASKFIARHRVGVATTIFALVALLAGMAVALREARVARQQAERARAERSRAERRFNDVRALAHALMFDINDAMTGVPGATAARKLLVSNALQYLDSLAAEANGDPPLQRELATAYERVAEIQGMLGQSQNLGNTSEALDSFRKAVRIRESLVAASPKDEAARSDLASLYRNLGELLAVRNAPAGALENDRKALSLYQGLHRANPNDGAVNRGLARTYYAMGRHLAFKGEWAPASQNLLQALAIVEPIWQAKPTDKTWGLTLGPILREACFELNKLGDRARALALCSEAASLSEKLASEYPDDVRSRFQPVVSQHFLGKVLFDQGDLEGSLKHWRKAVELGEALVAIDPKDFRSQEELANADNQLGLVLVKTGKTSGLHYELKALEMYKKFYASDPADKRKQELLASSFATLGDTEALVASRTNLDSSQNHRHWQQARSWYQQALQTLLELRSQGALRGEEAGEPDRVAREIAKCDSVLTRLKAQGAPKSHRSHGWDGESSARRSVEQ